MADINKDSDTGHVPIQTAILKKNAALDGGWGWFVVLSAFIINVIIDGFSYSFGVLFTNLIEYFHTSRSETAWIGSISGAVPLLCGPLASIISNKLGYRTASIVGGCITTIGFLLSYFVNSVEMLYIFYGVVAGLGISIPYLNKVVAISEYFEAKRSLVTGLSECGAGIGTVIFAPLLEVLISEYGWRGAFLIMGGIASNIIVCGSLFRPLCLNYLPEKRTTSPKSQETNSENTTTTPAIRASKSHPDVLQQKDTNSNSYNNIVDISALKNRIFLLLVFSNSVIYFWYDVPYTFTVDRMKILGTSEKDASLIIAVIGILHTIGNVLFGYLGDRKWINREILFCVSLIMCGTTLIAIPFFVTYIPSVILAGLFGLFSAAAEALCSVIIVDILGIKKLTNAYGIMMFLEGIACLVGAPFAGWLFDLSGKYINTFCAAGASIAAASIIYLFIPLLRICRKKNKAKLQQHCTVMTV